MSHNIRDLALARQRALKEAQEAAEEERRKAVEEARRNGSEVEAPDRFAETLRGEASDSAE